jgi:ADP-heptose:LPS heptosyltransferase
MKKVFAINGGAGRVICALPALEKYYKKHGDNFYIYSESGLEFFLGNKKLQSITFDSNTKGLFENYIKPNQLIDIEPYREHGYYNQKRSLTESFDFLINGTEDHSDLEKPKITLNKQEEITALDILSQLEKVKGKKKTIVFQPFGRSSAVNFDAVVDSSSRSLSKEHYIQMVKNLEKDYNIIYFGEHQIEGDASFRIQANLRIWAAIVEISDYFIGCDSVGQHLAYSFNKPGTVILGSTMEKNITYANHFQILRKPNIDIVYDPIRIQCLDSDLAQRYNDSCMDFTDKEVKDMIEKIRVDIKKKT